MISFFSSNKKENRTFEIQIVPKIIVKADDLYDFTQGMKKFVDYSFKQNLKINLGMIGKSLENPSKQYMQWLKKILQSGNVELFNHGYLHGRPLELCGPSFEDQKQSILKTQNIVKEKLGVTIHAIGTPENEKDDNTLKAVEAISDINTWYFGHENYSKYLYKREIYLEKPFPVPSFNHILDGFISKSKNLDVVVLECHPQLWYKNEWNIFYQIIEFLKQNNAEFVLSQELIKKDS